MILTKEWLKQNSEKSGILFADFLREILLEDLCTCIFSTAFSEKSLVLDSDVIFRDKLSLNQKNSNKKEDALVIWTKDALDATLQEVEDSLKNRPEVSWEILAKRTINGGLRLSVVGKLEDLQVPFSIDIKQEPGQLYIEKKKFEGICPYHTFDYAVCAPEQKLAESLYMIIDRMELLSEMQYYDLCSTILKSHAINGRRVTEELKKRWKANTFDNRLEIIRGYKNYRYMAKKWNSYSKTKAYMTGESVDAKWEELVDLICNFADPIYESLQTDSVFIGDWMPELGRFM